MYFDSKLLASHDKVSIKLNFTYVVREPSDGQFGVVRGGQWNGLIRSWSDMWKNRKCQKYENVNARQVIDKEVMLGAAAFTVSRERSQVQAYCLSLCLCLCLCS